MIRLTCANCQAQLEVDDAFAGGVCRCKHCGAIQTVPRAGRGAAPGRALAGGAVGGEEPKTLYQVKSRAGLASTPSGLEELAEAVHGSGLVGSGLLNRPVPRAPQMPAEPRKPKTGLILSIIGGLLAVAAVIGAVAFIAMRPTDAAPSPVSQAPPNARPAFGGVDLEGKKVVFVLDRGDATSAFFPALRDLTVKSVRSLGPDRLFQVVLWDNGSTDAYPALTPGYASAAEAEKLTRWFDQVSTGRSTDALPALRLALAGRPDTVVLATGKSLQLDASFAESVLTVRPAGSTTRVHAFSLGESAPDDPLRVIARRTSGQFKLLSGADLSISSE
ncbi:MAG TPA: hypothetical protein VF595_16170 [Tepidisphaeraceae bacterium]